MIDSLPYTGCLTVKEVKRHCDKILRNISPPEDVQSLSDLPSGDLESIIQSSEKISLGARQCLASSVERYREDSPHIVPDKAGYDISVRITEDSLTVRVPPTFLFERKDSWYLATCVREELEKLPVPLLSPPAVVVVKRKATGYRQGYKDNENYESSRIINAVMGRLGFTDRPDHLGYISLFDKVVDISDSCVEFTFMPLDTLLKDPSVLSFG